MKGPARLFAPSMVQHANQAGTSQVKAVEHEHAIDSKSVDIAR